MAWFGGGGNTTQGLNVPVTPQLAFQAVKSVGERDYVLKTADELALAVTFHAGISALSWGGKLSGQVSTLLAMHRRPVSRWLSANVSRAAKNQKRVDAAFWGGHRDSEGCTSRWGQTRKDAMALITCPECGKDVSTRAASCPHCGYPLEENPSNGVGDPISQSGSVEGATVRGGTRDPDAAQDLLMRMRAANDEAWQAARQSRPSQAAPASMPSATGALRCPHCESTGTVTSRIVKQKKGLSGSKATASVLTAGASLFVTGLSRKESVTELHCSKCRMTWHVS